MPVKFIGYKSPANSFAPIGQTDDEVNDMNIPRFLSRLARSAAAGAAALVLATSAAAAAPYTMTEHDGFVCVVDNATGALICCSDVPVALLTQRDQLLLEAGIPLESQADFTSAMEDFCS